MQKIGFDAEKYIEEQSKYILERINHGNSERLYLEFGGKLVHDKHAMRVLPGFDENAKIKLLQKMKDQAEIIICIYSGDIINSKTRQDFGITYDLEVLRLIDIFRKYDPLTNMMISKSTGELNSYFALDAGTISILYDYANIGDDYQL